MPPSNPIPDHLDAIVIGTGAGRAFIKQLGISDLYLPANASPHKLGYIQQLPIPAGLTCKSSCHSPWPGGCLGRR